MIFTREKEGEFSSLSCVLDNPYIRRTKLKALLMFKIVLRDVPLYLRTLFLLRQPVGRSGVINSKVGAALMGDTADIAVSPA